MFGFGSVASREKQQSEQRAEAIKELGNEYFRAGQYERALEQYTSAIALDPTNHVLYNNRALSYSALGRWEDALREADHALRRKPDSEKAHYRRGVALHSLGRTADAVAAFQDAVRLQPSSGEFRSALEAAKAELRSGSAASAQAAAKAFQAAVVAKQEFPLATYRARVINALHQLDIFAAAASTASSSASSSASSAASDPLGATAAKARAQGLPLELLDVIIAGYVGDQTCLIACAERSNTVHLRDPDTGDSVHTLTGHSDLVNCIAVLPGGTQVVTAGDDKRVKVWNCKTTVCTHTLDGHTQPITCLTVLPSGRLVVTGSRDGTLRVWDLTARREKCQLKGGHASSTDGGGGSGITAVIGLSDLRIVSGGGSLDRALCVWDIDSPYSAMCKQPDAHPELCGVSSLTPLPCAASYGVAGLNLNVTGSGSSSGSGSGSGGGAPTSPTASAPAASPLSRGTSTGSTDSNDVVADVSALFGSGGDRSPSPSPLASVAGAGAGASATTAAATAAAARPVAPAIPTDTFASCSAWSCAVKIWQYTPARRSLTCISTIVESAPVHRVHMLFPLGLLALSCTYGAVQLWSVRHAHPNTGGSGKGASASASASVSASAGSTATAANAARKHGTMYGHRNVAFSVAALPDGSVATGSSNNLMLWTVSPPLPHPPNALAAAAVAPPSLSDAADKASDAAATATAAAAAAAAPAAASIECLSSHRSRPNTHGTFGAIVDMAVVPLW